VRADRPEIGWHAVELASAAGADPLLASLPVRFTAFAWHSYEIVPPPGAETLARSSCCLQAFRRRERAWGIQFHAEVTLDTVGAWVEKDAEDAELRRAGIDPARLLEETEDRIARSNAVGETLCAGFLDLVADGVG
jgi:GMP synthase-like glutamine amidotransferase